MGRSYHLEGDQQHRRTHRETTLKFSDRLTKVTYLVHESVSSSVIFVSTNFVGEFRRGFFSFCAGRLRNIQI